MLLPEITDPAFREALAALDAGDVPALERLLARHPALVRDRLDGGEGYFHRPYLLWFVAENPIRKGALPKNIAAVARALITAARQLSVESLGEQLDSTLGLVASGRVARECQVQEELIEVLADAGASPEAALLPALAHRELAAAERLLARGARLSLLAAVCTGRIAEAEQLVAAASAADRQLALAGAALHGNPQALALLIETGVDLDAYSPEGFHSHAAPLHLAVDSGSLAAVQVLVEAGADPGRRDRLYAATPLGWAEYLQRTAIASFLKDRE